MGTVGYLLDTHSFLWAVSESQRLSEKAREATLDTTIPLFLSAVSTYEIMNKFRIGKLAGYESVTNNFFEVLHELGAKELPVSISHAHFAGVFEWSHRDPFDRLLAAQAYVEDLTLISNDAAFNTLPWISVVW
jgi:PIN domain nuclease of toxin-antitoxin system